MDPRSTFGRKKWTGGSTFFCQKWTCLAKAGEKSGPGPVSLSKSRQVHFHYPFLAGEKSGPGPVSLSKSRQVHFWQGKKVDPVQFHCQNPGRSIFGRGKKWTRSSFLPKSRQVHFWQGKKVDPVQFRCRNPSRSIFGRGKQWTWSSFAAEI